MNYIGLVEIGLKTEGFDGLVVPGECGCIIGDIAPGDCLCNLCEPAYKHTHSKRPEDWVTSKRKDGVTDEDLDQLARECNK